MNAPIRNMPMLPTDIVVPDWQLRSLIRIVALGRDPAWRDDTWFRELAERAGVDLTFADASNRRVSA